MMGSVAIYFRSPVLLAAVATDRREETRGAADRRPYPFQVTALNERLPLGGTY
jgi:hypothetical protein